ncbi:MAG TPA: hypothetical protein VJ843_03165 [Candidatus Saccharimonadales bacterium]|nr:hypothetical protein [Candidatus Saccharimonadales bacterium]
MASPELSVEEIKEIVRDIEIGDPQTNALLGLMTLSRAGCVFVGTTDPTPVEQHIPRPNPRIKSLVHDGLEFYLGDPEDSLLQVTWAGKLAIAHGLFGDVNVPDQREILGKSFGPFGRNYGWRSAPPSLASAAEGEASTYLLDEGDIIPHADRRLLTKLHQSPQEPGYVDILRPAPESTYEWCYAETADGEPTIRNGILLAREPQDVVARLTIRGRDIRLINIEARAPEVYERSVL